MYIVPRGPPSSITIISKTHNSVVMEISQPILQDRNGIIIGYTIQFTQVSNGTMKSFTTSEVEQPFIAEDLLPCTSYSYTVAARTASGTGPYSSSSSVTTNDTGKSWVSDAVCKIPDNHIISFNIAPSSAPNVSYTVQTSTTVSIMWTSISPPTCPGVTLQYRVRVRNTEDGSDRIMTNSSSPLLLSDLHPFYNYHVAVAAYTVALGPYSSSVLFQMPQDGMNNVYSGSNLHFEILRKH